MRYVTLGEVVELHPRLLQATGGAPGIGMIPIKRHRRRVGHPGKPTSQILAPNDVWSADYKGQFPTGDGSSCYPLTVADGFSRYLLGCQALPSTAAAGAKPVFMLRAAAARPSA